MEKILDVLRKTSRSFIRVQSVPNKFIITEERSINNQYTRLMKEFFKEYSEIYDLAKNKLYKLNDALIERSLKVENSLNVSLDGLNKMILHYPSPGLIDLRDRIIHNINIIKNVSDDQFEQDISSAINMFKDLDMYKTKAQESLQKKDFDSAAQWHINIISSYDRSVEPSRSAYRRLIHLEGNTSNLIKKLLYYNDIKFSAGNFYNHEGCILRDIERKWAKTLDDKNREEIANNIIKEAEKNIQLARQEYDLQNLDNAHVLYGVASYQLIRSLLYLDGSDIKISKVVGLYRQTRDYISGNRHGFYMSFRDIFRNVQVSLQKAEFLAHESQKILKGYKKSKGLLLSGDTAHKMGKVSPHPAEKMVAPK
ncbi:hypothetical protein V9J15_04235 [Candidatus Liberibacter africanus]|uniref:hypothetical protein n=1 Tax=Liberibacter africanus TaxID=34020 RepID=UPI00339D4766